MKPKSYVGVMLLLGVALFATGCGVAKPEPLTSDERQEYLREDQKIREAFNLPINGPMSLHEAMARTILANLDYRVKAMETAVAKGEFALARLEMLPSVRAYGGLTARSPESASSSISVRTRQESLEPSTSQEQERFIGDLTFSWNLLDLGLSYFQARQQANTVLIYRELRRKTIQNLLMEVQEAYWHAYFAQQFGPQVEAIIKKAEASLEKSREVGRRMLEAKKNNLRYQRTMLEVISQLQNLKRELERGRIDLLRLVNLPLDSKVTLVAPVDPEQYKGGRSVERPLPELKTLVALALDRRPELRQEMYKTRISSLEINKSWAKLLPGIELRQGLMYDSNKYLVDPMWYEGWLNITGNLVDVLTGPTRIEMAETSLELAKLRRAALNLAVISQVHMSVQQYQEAVAKELMSMQISDLDDRLAKLAEYQVKSSSQTPLEEIRHQASALFSKLTAYRGFSEVQKAYSRVLISVGVDLAPPRSQSAQLAQLTQVLRQREEQVYRWDLRALSTLQEAEDQADPLDEDD